MTMSRRIFPNDVQEGQRPSAGEENVFRGATRALAAFTGGPGIMIDPGLDEYHISHNRPRRNDPPALPVMIANVGAEDVEAYRPIKIVEPQGSTDAERMRRFTLEGRKPLSTDGPGKFGIAKVSIPAGQAGRAWITGACPAYISSASTWLDLPETCDLDGSRPNVLTPMSDGGVTMIYPFGALAAGSEVLGYVILPSVNVGGFARDMNIRITGSTAILWDSLGLPIQYEYDAEEVEKILAGYGGWQAKLGGWSGKAYNRTEDVNTASGGGTPVLPIRAAPDNLPREATRILIPGDYDFEEEVWFEFEWPRDEISETPCIDCASATPNATITITGSCPCGATCCCYNVAGTYNFVSFGGADPCIWQMKDASNNVFGLAYSPSSGLWTAQIQCISGPMPYDIYANNWGVTGVYCIGGSLVGSFTLAGIFGPGADCTGCTANITLF